MTERSDRIVNTLLDRAEQLASASDWRSVEQVCDEVLAIDPGNLEAESFKKAARSLNAAQHGPGRPQLYESPAMPVPVPAAGAWTELRQPAPEQQPASSWFADENPRTPRFSDDVPEPANILLFRGKIGRLQLLGVLMISNLIMWPVSIWLQLGLPDDDTGTAEVNPALWGMFFLLLAGAAWVELGGVVCRFRDTGKSPWWAVTLFIPIINVGTAVYLVFKPGRTFTRRRKSITGSN